VAQLLLTLEEAQAELSVSRTRMYELMRDGALRTVKIGRRRLVPRESLDDFVRCLIDAQQPGAGGR
jgi:excisionase family DNA binding protein